MVRGAPRSAPAAGTGPVAPERVAPASEPPIPRPSLGSTASEPPAGSLSASELTGQPPRAAQRLIAAALGAAGCPDAAYDARLLVREAIGADPRLAEAPLTALGAARLARLCAARCRRQPLQYLLGRWPFLDFTLAVGPGVLIPRADTETVCEAAAECLLARSQTQGPAPRALDLCAGSGALALGLRRLVPGARVAALEKSPEALCYLRKNAAEALRGLVPGPAAPQQGEAAVEVIEGDVFCYHKQLPPASLDLILSNPPYLTDAEMAARQPELLWEPALALSGGADGLAFYRHIAAAYRAALRPGGALVLEVGAAQAGAVTALLARHGWQSIETRRDLSGNPRAVIARAPKEP